MKEEFESKVKETLTDQDWDLVHTVYQWYPGVKDVEGKTQVAWLWRNFGKRVFVDMLPRATEAMECELKIQSLNLEIEKVRQTLNEL